MEIYEIDPIKDLRWGGFLERSADASVFHSPGWLAALARTYSYTPVVYTLTPPEQQLDNGLVFCHIRSVLTGNRLVSVPFSDHCQPLVTEPIQFHNIISQLLNTRSQNGWKYLELRPIHTEDISFLKDNNLNNSGSVYLHNLDISRPLPTIFKTMHASCIQRKIRRAEREKLVYEVGRSDIFLQKFYQLLIQTRRRHGVPPQPILWFRNLIECLRDDIAIHVASYRGQAVASIITLAFKQDYVYKYGCSNEAFNHLGGMPFLFWKIIEKAKDKNIVSLDLGRTDLGNKGLVAFKNHLGATNTIINYYRAPTKVQKKINNGGIMEKVIGKLIERTPDGLLILAGRLLYKHIG